MTNTSGSRVWVDLPQSVLLNGKGFYGDCALLQGGNSNPLMCNVTTASVPAGRSAINPQTTQANQGALPNFLLPSAQLPGMHLFSMDGTNTFQTDLVSCLAKQFDSTYAPA